jgi:hypothetical protein
MLRAFFRLQARASSEPRCARSVNNPAPPMTMAPIARATQDRTAGRQSPKLISLHMRASGRVSALEGRSKRTGMGRKRRSGKEGSETTPHCLDCFRPERKLPGGMFVLLDLVRPFHRRLKAPYLLSGYRMRALAARSMTASISSGRIGLLR